MSLSLRYAARSDVGLVREANEDSGYAGPRLLAVADGIGGHAAGEVASSVVIATVAALDRQDDTDVLGALRDAVETANTQLRDLVADDDRLEGMGTTLTALLWSGQRLGLLHVGDSRAYLYRSGELTQVTRDHTYVQSLVDAGRISKEEATTHPQRSLITRALDGRSAVDPDVSLREARVGDRWLLCTDGLSGVVSEETLRDTLDVGDPQAVVDRLVDLALRAGAPDNVTVVVADVVDEDPVDAVPLFAGAVATGEAGDNDEAPWPDSPAARAALAAEAGTEPGAEVDRSETAEDGPGPPGEPADLHDPPRRHRRRRVVVVSVLGVLILLAAAAGGAYAWIRSQWYVGTDRGAVAIYRGLPSSFAGLDLSSLAERSTLPVAALDPYEQERLADGVTTSSHTAARRLVRTLHTDACRRQAPPPTAASPTPTAGRTASPATSPHPTSPVASPRTAAIPTRPVSPPPTVSPTPSPLVTDCGSSP